MHVAHFLSTERLFIQPLTVNDDHFILELVNTEGWKRFIGDRKVTSIEDARVYIQRIINSRHIQYWVVFLITAAVPVGIVTYIQRDYLQHPDIGFAFLPSFSKQGYAYEATQAVLRKLMHEQTRPCVQAITSLDNISSIKLLTKLGFTFDKQIMVDQEQLYVYSLYKIP